MQLILAAILAVVLGPMAIRFADGNIGFFHTALAIDAISPPVSAILGLQYILPGAYLLACVGLSGVLLNVGWALVYFLANGAESGAQLAKRLWKDACAKVTAKR